MELHRKTIEVAENIEQEDIVPRMEGNGTPPIAVIIPKTHKASVLDLKEEQIKGKIALARVDYNVPLDKKTGEITDPKRIIETIPTIKNLFGKGVTSVVLMSHLGRPEGKYSEKNSLEQIATELQKHLNKLNKNVVFIPMEMLPLNKDAMMPTTYQYYLKHTVPSILKNAQKNTVYVLENVRFDAREEKNSEEMALELAQSGPYGFFVNDAFGAAHRAHSSTEGATKFFAEKKLPVVAGLLMNKEIYYGNSILNNPQRPLKVIIGGAKVGGADGKLNAIQHILDKMQAGDSILIGGGMAYTFLKAQAEMNKQDFSVGNSLFEEKALVSAMSVLGAAEEKGVKVLLPVDSIVAKDLNGDAPVRTAERDIPEGLMGLDIGPQTIELYSTELANAETIIWNGPMGVFEDPRFAAGTNAIAQSLAVLSDLGCTTVVGGGESASAVEKSGYINRITYVSTGGGAFLEMLEGRKLPGIEALNDRALDILWEKLPGITATADSKALLKKILDDDQ